MSSYTRDAIIAFILALAVVAICGVIALYSGRSNTNARIKEVARIEACTKVESEALRTMCVNGIGRCGWISAAIVDVRSTSDRRSARGTTPIRDRHCAPNRRGSSQRYPGSLRSMMQFWTHNSIYEVSDGRIRRLMGAFDPQPRQGPDGEWKEFLTISEPTLGQPVTIVWRIVEKDGNLVAESTITGPVTHVQDELLEREGE